MAAVLRQGAIGRYAEQQSVTALVDQQIRHGEAASPQCAIENAAPQKKNVEAPLKTSAGSRLAGAPSTIVLMRLRTSLYQTGSPRFRTAKPNSMSCLQRAKASAAEA